jgi:hypothetical protein
MVSAPMRAVSGSAMDDKSWEIRKAERAHLARWRRRHDNYVLAWICALIGIIFLLVILKATGQL